MGQRKNGSKSLRFLLPLGVGALALITAARGPVAEISEIDAFQRAIRSQTKADALAFVRDFGSSHLIPDLIDLLRPDVALGVCADVSGSSSRARTACDKVRAAATVEPAAGPGTPSISVVAPTSLPSTATTPTPPAAVPAPAIVPTAPPSSARVTEIPKARVADLPAPLSKTPASPTSRGAPTEPSAAPPTVKQVAAVPPVQQNSAATSERKVSSANDTVDRWRKLTARFSRGPFKVNYSDRARGEIFVTYSGSLGRFVACGDTVGVPKAPLKTWHAERDELNSRMIIHVSSTSLSVDALHIVALSRPTSRSPDLVNVRHNKPTRTPDGEYCWSTGEMERLARMR